MKMTETLVLWLFQRATSSPSALVFTLLALIAVQEVHAQPSVRLDPKSQEKRNAALLQAMEIKTNAKALDSSPDKVFRRDLLKQHAQYTIRHRPPAEQAALYGALAMGLRHRNSEKVLAMPPEERKHFLQATMDQEYRKILENHRSVYESGDLITPEVVIDSYVDPIGVLNRLTYQEIIQELDPLYKGLAEFQQMRTEPVISDLLLTHGFVATETDSDFREAFDGFFSRHLNGVESTSTVEEIRERNPVLLDSAKLEKYGVAKQKLDEFVAPETSPEKKKQLAKELAQDVATKVKDEAAKAAAARAEDKRKKREQSENEYRQKSHELNEQAHGFDLVSGVIGLGDPGAGRTVGVLSSSYIGIQKAVLDFSFDKISSLVLVHNLFKNILSIGSLLSGGKTFEQTLMESIQEISKQIHSLRKEMNERFTYVDLALGEALDEFERVRNDLSCIRDSLNSISIKLDRYYRNLYIKVDVIGEASLTAPFNNAVRDLETASPLNFKTFEKTFASYGYQSSRDVRIVGSQSEFALINASSWSDYFSNDVYNVFAYAAALKSLGADRMMSHAERLYGTESSASTIPHLSLWIDGVQKFLDLHASFSGVSSTDTKHYVDELIRSGEQIRKALFSVIFNDNGERDSSFYTAWSAQFMKAKKDLFEALSVQYDQFRSKYGLKNLRRGYDVPILTERVENYAPVLDTKILPVSMNECDQPHDSKEITIHGNEKLLSLIQSGTQSTLGLLQVFEDASAIKSKLKICYKAWIKRPEYTFNQVRAGSDVETGLPEFETEMTVSGHLRVDALIYYDDKVIAKQQIQVDDNVYRKRNIYPSASNKQKAKVANEWSQKMGPAYLSYIYFNKKPPYYYSFEVPKTLPEFNPVTQHPVIRELKQRTENMVVQYWKVVAESLVGKSQDYPEVSEAAARMESLITFMESLRNLVINSLVMDKEQEQDAVSFVSQASDLDEYFYGGLTPFVLRPSILAMDIQEAEGSRWRTKILRDKRAQTSWSHATAMIYDPKWDENVADAGIKQLLEKNTPVDPQHPAISLGEIDRLLFELMQKQRALSD